MIFIVRASKFKISLQSWMTYWYTLKLWWIIWRHQGFFWTVCRHFFFTVPWTNRPWLPFLAEGKLWDLIELSTKEKHRSSCTEIKCTFWLFNIHNLLDHITAIHIIVTFREFQDTAAWEVVGGEGGVVKTFIKSIIHGVNLCGSLSLTILRYWSNWHCGNSLRTEIRKTDFVLFRLHFWNYK